MRTTRRSLAIGASALVLGLGLAACGSDDGDGETSGSAGSAGTSEQLPVTIEHKYGETTFTEVPERVVVVGLQEQDTLIDLGIVPVGVTFWFGEESGINPWAEEALPEGAEMPEVLDATNGIPVEKVAALKPDLIIGEYSAMTEKEFELLSAIAPTLAQSGEYADYSMPWQEMALKVGQAVGQGEEIQEKIDAVEAQFAQYASDNPDFEGKTVALVTPYEGLFVYGPDDPRARLLESLGFDTRTSSLFNDQNEFGGSLSAERTADVGNLDMAVWYDLSADKTVLSVYEGTDQFKNGSYVDIGADDGAYYVAHSFTNTLALPYVLERYVPQLAAAVDGDPATKVPAVTD
ncbi:ABC transporter substrate-binding protein [Nocardioides sp. R-C-SC26]|uniref:ABC transporter substrate-binding protein n=1 Tax=Nocardioides sp. R-C-SC26 TaxID=2870414 RepID=UPI001E403E38|nr:ABC transporter substrate-binding protein [Nocardioides sp. R-C-SC26]